MAKKKDKKKLPAQSENSFDEKQQQYNDLVNQCLEIIKKYKILFIKELVAFLPFNRSTYYAYQLDKSDILKEAIDNNKILTKQGLRGKWYDSDNPVCQIALYKLICTEEERNAISNHQNQQSGHTANI